MKFDVFYILIKFKYKISDFKEEVILFLIQVKTLRYNFPEQT